MGEMIGAMSVANRICRPLAGIGLNALSYNHSHIVVKKVTMIDVYRAFSYLSLGQAIDGRRGKKTHPCRISPTSPGFRPHAELS